MKLHEFVVTEAIIPSLQGTDRDKVVKELIDSLVEGGAIPAAIREDLIKQIIDRERKGSTGFGKGVAVPHVKHAKIKKMAAAIGVSQKGIDFNSLDKAPVFAVVLLLSPAEKADEHLQAMDSIFGNLMKDTFRRFLRQATTVQEIRDLLMEADAQQLQG